MPEQRLLDIDETHQNAAGICIRAAGYLLVSLAQFYRADMALFGFQVVARAIVENAAKARWLVDPTASIDTRLARLYSDKLDNTAVHPATSCQGKFACGAGASTRKPCSVSRSPVESR
jgi:hypothetical protein